MPYLCPTKKVTIMRRIFKITVEPEESQVTLSSSLVAHMLRHNRHGRSALRVIPVQCDGLYGLDVNPPERVLDAEVQDTMAEVQWDDRSRSTGFQMEDPTVFGLLSMYGIVQAREEAKPFYMLRVEARRTAGRWIYWILPDTDDVDEWLRLDRWQRWTQRLQRWHII